MPDVTTPDTHAIEGVLEAVPMVVKESKPGIKTTEFWLVIVIAVLTQINAIPLPDKYQGFVTAGLGVAYALSRGIAKNSVPVVEAPPA